MNTLLVLLGPTGVGKTETSLQIAERLKSHYLFRFPANIPADSIGTAAPTAEQLERILIFRGDVRA